MLEHVVVTDVQDESPARPGPSDISEVLLGSHADVDTPGRPQTVYDLNIGSLVGNEIVGIDNVRKSHGTAGLRAASGCEKSEDR